MKQLVCKNCFEKEIPKVLTKVRDKLKQPKII